MTTTTPAALRAQGAALPGQPDVRLRYDFLSLLAIEETYGSIQDLLDKVATLEGADVASSPILGTVIDLLRFGMEPNEAGVHPSRVQAARGLDLRSLSAYVGAAKDALEEAFGPQDPTPQEGRVDPTGASTGSSGGRSPLGIASSDSSGA